MNKSKLAAIIIVCTVAIIVTIALFSIRPWERTYTLSVDINPPDAGFVFPAAGDYESGERVTLTAVPSSGYTFDYWSGDAAGTGNTVTITMNDHASVTANFVRLHPIVPPPRVKYTLTISTTIGGRVTTPGEGSFTRDAGTVVSLVATPDAGHSFVNWAGDVGTIADVNDATTTITITSDKTITARFKLGEPPPKEPADFINWHEARNYIGERTTVRGPVVSAVWASGSRGQPTFLNLGNPFPNPDRFTVVIWIQNRGKFPQPPEEYYLGKTICVTGLITSFRGIPQIEVTDPAQIRICSP
jgi:uncharacterized repeat protein (TIGR02543 family)